MGGGKSGACFKAFRNLMAALTAADTRPRMAAWSLFEAMLPRLHEHGAPLDAQYATNPQVRTCMRTTCACMRTKCCACRPQHVAILVRTKGPYISSQQC